MKKQTKSNWQTIVFAAIAAVVFMFAANSPASAQTTYKVGDKIQVESSGTWYKAEILEIKDGLYKIHYDGYASSFDEWVKPARMRFGTGQETTYKVGDRAEILSAGAWVEVEILEVKDTGQYLISPYGVSRWVDSKYLRPKKADAQTDNRNNTGNQVQNQTNGNTQTTNGGGTIATQKEESIFERYGSREPRTCEDTKAPARGAITAALATKYVICRAEKVWSNDLYLVENVKVNEVGSGIPYQAIRGQYSWDQVDVNYPVYPIRGSLVSYQCRNLLNEYVGPPNANCATSNETKASGYCYKTTFRDWQCFMSDPARMEKGNYRTGIAPPKP